MNKKNTNVRTSMEDKPLHQFEISLGQISSLDARWEDEQEEAPVSFPDPPARAQAHMRRLPVGGLCETDPRRCAKTEYVMRMLVSGRAPAGESPVPEPPAEPGRPAAPGPEHSGEPEARPEVMTLENLTFDDLLAELENL